MFPSKDSVKALPLPARPPVRIVGIGLMQTDQSTYRGLRIGDRVLIEGTLAPDRRHVIARDICRDDSRGAWTQSF